MKASNTKTLLVTVSSGLIVSEVVKHFLLLGWDVHGVDNNIRADFFGPQGDMRLNYDDPDYADGIAKDVSLRILRNGIHG